MCVDGSDPVGSGLAAVGNQYLRYCVVLLLSIVIIIHHSYMQ
eukprot:COSAG01_NODE_1036_length_11988_cov_10.055345_1_plen_42_part_00